MKQLYFILLYLLFQSSLSAQNLYFPPLTGDEWESQSPESLNWCTDKIDPLLDYLEAEDSKSFLVLKDGKIVIEAYFDGFTKDSTWAWFSAGKTLRAALIGIAQEEGLLDINDKTADYLGQGWTNLPQEKEELITIWHQLTMTSGLDEAPDIFCTIDTCLNYKADAGNRWYYHNAPYSLTKDVLESASNTGLNLYTQQKIKNKIGMKGLWVPVQFNTFYFSTARDMARFGLLIQNAGQWDNTPVIADANYVAAMITPSQSLNPSYGYLWWLNGQSSFIPPGTPNSFNSFIAPDAPADVYSAIGAEGQIISVSPSNGIVMIRQGVQNNQSLVPIDLVNETWKRLMEVACISTSTQTPIQNNAIALFPNPATNQVSIVLDSDENFEIAVFDLLGKKIFTQKNNELLKVGHFQSGVYQVLVNQGDKQYLERLVIH